MDFFTQFKWAVPDAFSDALSACRFEQGDTFYDNTKAYKRWDEALKFLNYSIQVRYPKRQGGTTQKKSRLVFENNWSSSVQIELTDYKNKSKNELVDSTQGRLCSVLWHGNLNVLYKNTPEPPLPLLLPEAKKLLKDTIGKFKEKAREKISDPFLFIMAYDPLNATTYGKYSRIEVRLKKNFDILCFELSSEASGITHWQDLFPTICFKCFAIKEDDKTKIHNTLKDVLYKPSSTDQKAEGSKKDRFSLKTHGLLVKV